MTDESTIEAPDRARRKVREGTVRSNKMDKTVVVEVVRRSSHPQYNKTVQHNRRYVVHDEENTLREGDRVRIVETRPLSKTKRWRLLEILERAR
jgi:small subunit ribosomal protein S17